MNKTFRLWQRTGNIDSPYISYSNCVLWRVCVNSFPENKLYTVLQGDQVVTEFNDWPKEWPIIGM